MIGIYKITSPSKRIYIGQSVNIKRRFAQYKRLDGVASQVRLYRSLLKHGIENHIFEVVCQCEIGQLNDMERFYQDFYFATSSNGLNCTLTKSSDRVGVLSQETKNKIRIAQTGRTASVEARLKMSIAHKGKIISEEQKAKISVASRNRSPESNLRISIAKKGIPRTPEAIANMVLGNKNRTDEHKEKLRIAQTGRRYSVETKLKVSIASKLRATKEGALKMQEASRKKVIDTVSGIIYSSLTVASAQFGIPRETLSGYLRGASPNKTSLKYI